MSFRFGFEKKCTVPNADVYAKGDYFGIVARKIGSLNFVIAGEVDCVVGT